MKTITRNKAVGTHPIRLDREVLAALKRRQNGRAVSINNTIRKMLGMIPLRRGGWSWPAKA